MIWKFLRPQLLSIVCASIMSLVLGAVSALIAIAIGPTIQLFMNYQETGTKTVESLVGQRLAAIVHWVTGIDSVSVDWLWSMIPITLVLLAVTRATLSVGQWFMWERAGELMAKRWRQAILNNYLHIDPEARRLAQGRQWEGELTSLLTNDIRMVREYVVRVYGAIPREICQIAFLIGSLILLSPKMFALFAFALGPALVIAARLGKRLRRRTSAALKDYSSLTEWIQQRLLGIETIKQYRTEELEAAAMQKLNASLLQRFLKVLRVKSLTSPALEAIAIMAMAVVLWIALNDVLFGDVAGGVQLSFFSTLALLAQAADRCGRYFNANREGKSAAERLAAAGMFFGATQQTSITPWHEIDVLPSNTLQLSIENLLVRYPERSNDALMNVSMEFRAGSFYCVCGPSGAGKSTLLKVMLGLVKPTAGKIALKVPSAQQSTIGYMPQQFQLMHESIAANIAFPDPLPDQQRVEQALEEVGMRDFVSTLPQTLNEIVGTGGRTLSGGQMQKLQLARIIYHQYPVIMVDEGTSALDPLAEQQMLQLVRRLTAQQRIVIMIAHRPAVAALADQILLLDKGQLIQQGPAQQVMRGPDYQRLVGNVLTN